MCDIIGERGAGKQVTEKISYGKLLIVFQTINDNQKNMGKRFFFCIINKHTTKRGLNMLLHSKVLSIPNPRRTQALRAQAVLCTARTVHSRSK